MSHCSQILTVLIVALLCTFSAFAGSLRDNPRHLKQVLRQEQAPVAAQQLTADADAEDDDDDWDDDDEPLPTIADPLKYWNKLWFHFNDVLIVWVMGPVSKGYTYVLPTPVRTGIGNVFHNAKMPIRLVGCLTQGKVKNAGREVGRFLINTTVGVAGIMDVAEKKKWLVTPPREDFGQTLGVWGIGHGIYLTWPFIGPSSLRDTVGYVGGSWADPINYVAPAELGLGLSTWRTLNDIDKLIKSYETALKGAIDPYEAIKNFYIQMRLRDVRK